MQHQRRILTADQFRQELVEKMLPASSGDNGAGEYTPLPVKLADPPVVLKDIACAIVRNGNGPRTFTFTISTAQVDRMGDTIAVDGWQLDAYRRNPVVLWAHAYTSLPVGRALRVWKDGGALMATMEFTPEGVVRFNDTVAAMVRDGWLNAVSVGFVPKEFAFARKAGREFGIDFKQQELIEFSVVPVPANPAALLDGRAAPMSLPRRHREVELMRLRAR